MPKSAPLIERFWSKVEVRGPDECWPWKAGGNKKGYGTIRMPNPRRYVQATHASWFLAHGAWPKPLWVLHRCDNPICVNSAHLFLGTRADNMADAVSKSRQAKGSSNGMSKLSRPEVVSIRALVMLGVSQKVVKNFFHISAAQTSKIVNGKQWAAI